MPGYLIRTPVLYVILYIIQSYDSSTMYKNHTDTEFHFMFTSNIRLGEK